MRRLATGRLGVLLQAVWCSWRGIVHVAVHVVFGSCDCEVVYLAVIAYVAIGGGRAARQVEKYVASIVVAQLQRVSEQLPDGDAGRALGDRIAQRAVCVGLQVVFLYFYAVVDIPPIMV